MKILYYDCFAGISGDMNLAAMLDIGVESGYLLNELSKLKLDEFEVKISSDKRKGIGGTRVDVILKSETKHLRPQNLTVATNQEDNQEHDHQHEHGQTHKHTHSHHSVENKNDESEHQGHRNLRMIEEIIDLSGLNENVKGIAKQIFYKIAEAEGKVHQKSIYDIHFHEVGAVDSIVDIVGAAICIDFLKVDKILCSTIELGGGMVKCAHGYMPVPAPATSEILTGIPVKKGAVQYETTTPTGAAILAAIVNEFTDITNFVIKKTGYGIGHKDGHIPNVLRVFLGEKDEKDLTDELEHSDYRQILECNIDDMNPENYSYLIDDLFKIGAGDVYLTPVIMKKGRPGIILSVLVEKEKEKEIIEFLLKETTSFGIRTYSVKRTILNRSFSKIETRWGEVTIKSGYYKGIFLKSKPEYEDCRRIAIENNVPLNEVMKEINQKLFYL